MTDLLFLFRSGRNAERRAALFAPRSARWRYLAIALALAFAVASVVAGSHLHDLNEDHHHCLQCSVAADLLPAAGKLPTVALVLILLRYLCSVRPTYRGARRTARLLPPACGPPGVMHPQAIAPAL